MFFFFVNLKVSIWPRGRDGYRRKKYVFHLQQLEMDKDTKGNPCPLFCFKKPIIQISTLCEANRAVKRREMEIWNML